VAATRRVLIVSEHPYPDHATVRRNVGELLGAGLHVDLVCLAPRALQRAATETPAGLAIHALRMAHRRSGALRYLQEYVGFWLWSFVVCTGLAIRHRYVSVLVDNPPDFVIFAPIVARLRGARLVLEMFELVPELTAARMRLDVKHPAVRIATWLERLSTRWADRVIVVSRQCRDVLAARDVDVSKISVVPNTLPGSRMAPSAATLTGDRPFIVTHCSLIERYGVQVAIEAMSHLGRKRPDLVLRVLGEGEYKSRLVELADELGVGERVVFRGFLPWAQAMDEIRQAAVGIVAIIADGYGELLLPTKLMEYAENGVPVACADLPTIAHHFPPSSLAYFRPGDARALADQVDRLLAHPDEARAQAARAKDAMRALTWDAVSPGYMAALGLADLVPVA
jgi:glycosyltransferase involved in cell wall biosynthesis